MSDRGYGIRVVSDVNKTDPSHSSEAGDSGFFQVVVVGWTVGVKTNLRPSLTSEDKGVLCASDISSNKVGGGDEYRSVRVDDLEDRVTRTKTDLIRS